MSEGDKLLIQRKQARKPRSYASLKLRPTHLLIYLLTRVKCRATSVAKNICPYENVSSMTSKMLTFWSKSDLVCVKRVLKNMATVPLMLVGPGVHC